MPEKPNLFESPTEELVQYFDDYKAWVDSQKAVTQEYGTTLEPGYWTEFEINVSPAQFSDLDEIFFEIQTSAISLNTRNGTQ